MISLMMLHRGWTPAFVYGARVLCMQHILKEVFHVTVADTYCETMVGYMWPTLSDFVTSLSV